VVDKKVDKLNKVGHGLADLTLECFGTKLPKEEFWKGQKYNTYMEELSRAELRYMARDAVATLDVGLEFARRGLLSMSARLPD